MRIPEIQKELFEIATDVRIPISVRIRMKALINGLYRRKQTTGKVTSKHMTPAIRKAIWGLHIAHPDMSQQEIANDLGINPGRVSEELKGKRT